MYNHGPKLLFDGSHILIDVQYMSAFVEEATRRGYYLIKAAHILGNDAYKVYFDEEIKDD